MNWFSLVDEFAKLATGVSIDEANQALTRLHRLEESKPSGSDLVRGAVAGTGIGIAGNLAGSSIAGTRAPIRALVPGGPTLGRQIAGAAIPGVLFGAALPVLKRKMDEGAEVEKLRSNLGMSNVGSSRSKVRQVLGVG